MWNDWNQYGHMGSAAGWHWGVHIVFGLLLLALIVMALIALFRYLREGTRSAGTGAGTGSPLTTLEERYARGEIDREEFLAKKKDLTG